MTNQQGIDAIMAEIRNIKESIIEMKEMLSKSDERHRDNIDRLYDYDRESKNLIAENKSNIRLNRNDIEDVKEKFKYNAVLTRWIIGIVFTVLAMLIGILEFVVNI